MLRAARIGSIDDPKAQLTLRQLEALLAAAERLSGRLDLGFELGRRVKTTSHDILGFALLTSPTLRHALRLLSSYQRLINPAFTLELQRRAGRVDLLYRPAVALSASRDARAAGDDRGVESLRVPARCCSGTCRRTTSISRSSGRRTPGATRTSHRPGCTGATCCRACACRSTPRCSTRRWRMANPRAMQAAEERCVAMMRGARGRPRWSEWCRMMLREAEDSQPTLEQLAGFVNLSARTLGRYLDAENTRFRELSLQVRTERAAAHAGRRATSR